MVDEILGALVPDVESCRAKAAKLRASYPGLDEVALAEKAVSQARRWATAAGAAGGAFGNPMAMVPLAAAEIGGVLKLEANMAGVVAALLEPDILQDPAGLQADVLAILFPSAASQALREFAVRAGKATTRTLIRKYISKNVLRAIIRFAARYLGLKLTQKALITKSVPLIGSGIGATWNWVEVKMVGRRAIAYYKDEQPASAST